MTATESTPVVEAEWRGVGVADAERHGGDRVPCDRCHTMVRWVHRLRNADGTVLRVGRCCAKRLTRGSYDATAAERRASNRAKRFETFRTRKWRQSQANSGNVWRNVLVGKISVRVSVFPRGGGFCGCVALGHGTEPTYTGMYPTPDDVKAVLFDVVEELRLEIATKPPATGTT